MLIDKFLSKIRWWVDSNPADYDINLDKTCEFITAGEQPDIEVFRSYGIVVVNGLISAGTLNEWSDTIEKFVKINKYKKNIAREDYWMASISDIPELYNVVYNDNVIGIVEALIGKERKFVGHDSVTINYSVPGHHDDQNTHKDKYTFEEYPDNFSTIRTLCYVGGKHSAPQRFGFVPASHQRKGFGIDYNFSKKNTVWVEVSHGTMIFFDPRLVHTASPLTHTKKMIVGTYDLESEYTKNIFFHTAINRKQGARPENKDFWAELEKYDLKPSFLND